jgi:hemoglobin/transferrin/lactoferrin receptor protein
MNQTFPAIHSSKQKDEKMYRWILSLTLLLLTAPLAAHAKPDSVFGRVTAADTDAPLVGAHVMVAGTPFGAVTDADGRYAISSIPAGEQFLVATFVGYGTTTHPFIATSASIDSIDFSLQTTLLPQEAIIVTARGRPSRLTELAGSAGVIDRFDIAALNPTSIADAATLLPGISLGSDMPWSSRVQIRGLSRDHVVFLIDGNRVSTTSQIAAQFGTVPPEDVAQIELLKGPLSVLYGTGSTGGVVNVIPHRGRFSATPQWDIALSHSYESASAGLSSYGRVGFNAPRFYLMLSQSYRDYASYTDGGGQKIANSQFEDYQSHLNLGLRLHKSHTLDFRYQWFTARDVGIPGAGGVFPNPATVTYPRTGRRLAEISWRYQPNSSIWRESELSSFLQTVERRTEVIPNIAKYIPATGEQPLRRARPQLIQPAADHNASGFRWNNQLQIGSHQLVLGLEGWRKQLSSSRRRVTEVDVLRPDSTLIKTIESISADRPLPESTYTPFGLYAEDEFHPMQTLTINAGARIDLIRVENERTFRTYTPPTDQILWEATDDTDLSWSAQLRLTYAMTPTLNAYFNLARSFRSPGLEERYLYVDLGSLVRIGDPALDSESGAFFESGASLQTDRLLLNGQLFYNRIKNLVIETPSTFEGRNALLKTNAGDALFIGFESDLAFTLHPRLLLAADIAYVRGTDEKEDSNLPAVAPLTSHLSLRYGGPLWCQAELEMVASQNRVASGELPTDAHRTLDLTAGYNRLRTGDLRHRITIGLKNPLDARYRDHLATSRGFELNSPGRSLFLNWALEM